MKYRKVFLSTIGYELAPVVVTSNELEERLAPVYETLHFPAGQLESLTGIRERRWWERESSLTDGAVAAARKTLETADIPADAVGALFYAGVNRESFEPATACHVAAELGVGGGAAVYDISNACLGVMNGMVEIANQIELGQIRAGLVVSCETAREIVETMIERMLETPTLDFFTKSLATLTGGSGAAAVLLTDGSFGAPQRRKMLGGVSRSAPEHFRLCRWTMAQENGRTFRPLMYTDAPAVLRHGVELGARTWEAFLNELEWNAEDVDKVVCHQVGASNRQSILSTIGLPEEKDFSTFSFLGNIGTVSLPMTAALAEEREFLRPGDRVALLGIGSGLNCQMLGFEW